MLVFIDESGHPIPTDSAKRPVLLAFCVKPSEIGEITRRIHTIKLDIMGNGDLEIKAKDIINRGTLKKNHTKKMDLVDRIIDLIDGYDVGIFSIVMKKPSVAQLITPEFFPNHFSLLLQRVNQYAELKRTSAMLIFDDRSDAGVLSKGFYNFIFKSARGQSLNRIIESVHFVDSKYTPGIQLADLFAGITRNYYETREDSDSEYGKWIERLYLSIIRKTKNFRRNGCTNYGFYQMPECFPEVAASSENTQK